MQLQPQEQLLECVTLEPKQPAERSIIWLHGLGADGHDFVPIVPQLQIQDTYNIRFIFPHATKMPVTINNGYIMPAWFDIYGLDKNSKEDNLGIKTAAARIHQLIEKEHSQGIAFANILLIGFSQGGALALYSGLQFEHKLGAIIGLSCYLPQFNQKYHAANKTTPIMLAHGDYDPVVLKIYGEAARDRLSSLDYKVQWQAYPMQHQVCMEEIQHISKFIRTIFE